MFIHNSIKLMRCYTMSTRHYHFITKELINSIDFVLCSVHFLSYISCFAYCFVCFAYETIFCNFSKSSKLVWCLTLNNYLSWSNLFNYQSVINLGSLTSLVQFINAKHADMLDFFVDNINLYKHGFNFS